MELGLLGLQAAALILVSPSTLGMMWELVSRLAYQHGSGFGRRTGGSHPYAVEREKLRSTTSLIRTCPKDGCEDGEESRGEE